MLKWAIVFLLLSAVAGLFGFTGIAVGTQAVAKLLFFLFFVIAAIVLVFGVIVGRFFS